MFEQTIGSGGPFGVLLDSAIRTISHLNQDHLMGNIRNLLIYSIIMSFRQELKTVFIQFVVLIIGSTVILTHYTNVVGFSHVISGSLAISLYLSIEWVGLNVTKYTSKKKEAMVALLPAFYFTLLVFDSGKQIIADFLIVVGIATIENPGIASHFTDVSNEIYGVESAELHIFGFILGSLIVMFTIIQNRMRTRIAQ